MLTKLLLSDSQVVLLDMEAGVEHLGRGTIAGVDHLLIVVNPTRSSVRTAMKIKKLAKDVAIPKVSFVGNLIADAADSAFLVENLGEKPVASFPDLAAIKKAEREGKPITSIADQLIQPSSELVEYLLQ